MRTLFRLICTLIVVVLASCEAGQAAILVDQSPGTWGATSGDDLFNNQAGSSYAEKFVLASGAQLTGIDIFSENTYGTVGTIVLIRIWEDLAGEPGSIIQQYTSAITVVDSESAGSEPGVVRKYAGFLHTASAGTYWIGMTGFASEELGQRFFPGATNITPSGDDQVAIFDGLSGYAGLGSFGDMAFRLHGESTLASTPEPASMAMWCLGGLGCALVAHRRRKRGG